MRKRLLDLMVCPACHGSLNLHSSSSAEEQEVLEGELGCSECGECYPIIRGVPRMALEALSEAEVKTVDGFGWQWNRFDELISEEEEREQFLDWVRPLTGEAFRDAVVLDAGCGMGRWPDVVKGFGATDIIAVDLSSAVEAAFLRLRDAPNVHVVQGNILNLPFRTGADSPIDLAYSIGVIHHMPDPRAGFLAMRRHVKPGGRVHTWVYGAEGNEWIERFVTPFREHVAARLPKRALMVLSFLLSLPVHVVSVAARLGLSGVLPYGAYLAWLGRFRFRHTHHVVFDHLNPQLAFYLSKEEVEEWGCAAKLDELSITPRNNQSWRIVGRATDAPA